MLQYNFIVLSYYKKLHLYNINLLYIIIYIDKASGSFYLI